MAHLLRNRSRFGYNNLRIFGSEIFLKSLWGKGFRIFLAVFQNLKGFLGPALAKPLNILKIMAIDTLYKMCFSWGKLA